MRTLTFNKKHEVISEAYQSILNESMPISDKEVKKIADIFIGKTGLDSAAPMKEYYKEMRNIKSLKKMSDDELKALIADLENEYPKLFGM